MKRKYNYFVFLLLTLFFACEIKVSKDGSDIKIENSVYLAYDLRMSGKADSALMLLEQTLKEDSTNALAWYEISRTRLHYLPQDMDKAEILEYLMNTVEKAINLDPENALFYPYANLVIDLNMDWNRKADSEAEWIKQKYKNYKKLIELNPDDLLVKSDLLYLCIDHADILQCDKGDLNKLADEINEADEVLGAIVMSELYEEVDYDCSYWKEMTRKHPDHPFAYSMAGRCSTNSGSDADFGEGIGYDCKSISLDPYFILTACWTMKYFYFYIGENPEKAETYVKYAEDITEAFLSLDSLNAYPPVQAYLYAALARIYGSVNEPEKSKQYWTKAEELDPFIIEFPIPPTVDMFTPLIQ